DAVADPGRARVRHRGRLREPVSIGEGIGAEGEGTMTPAQFLARVTLDSAVMVGTLALAAAWLIGKPAAIGVAAGGGLAIGSLWWLARGALAMSRTSFERSRWMFLASLRFVAIGGVAAYVLASGLAHPVALVVGLTVLPCALTVEGLRSAARP